MLLIKLKYSKVGQTSRSRSQVETVNNHGMELLVKYQSPYTHYLNIIKFSKSRSNSKVKFIMSKILVPMERSCLIKYSCEILKL